jgi:hypothetical protein
MTFVERKREREIAVLPHGSQAQNLTSGRAICSHLEVEA